MTKYSKKLKKTRKKYKGGNNENNRVISPKKKQKIPKQPKPFVLTAPTSSINLPPVAYIPPPLPSSSATSVGESPKKAKPTKSKAKPTPTKSKSKSAKNNKFKPELSFVGKRAPLKIISAESGAAATGAAATGAAATGEEETNRTHHNVRKPFNNYDELFHYLGRSGTNGFDVECMAGVIVDITNRDDENLFIRYVPDHKTPEQIYRATREDIADSLTFELTCALFKNTAFHLVSSLLIDPITETRLRHIDRVYDHVKQRASELAKRTVKTIANAMPIVVYIPPEERINVKNHLHGGTINNVGNCGYIGERSINTNDVYATYTKGSFVLPLSYVIESIEHSVDEIPAYSNPPNLLPHLANTFEIQKSCSEVLDGLKLTYTSKTIEEGISYSQVATVDAHTAAASPAILFEILNIVMAIIKEAPEEIQRQIMGLFKEITGIDFESITIISPEGTIGSISQLLTNSGLLCLRVPKILNGTLNFEGGVISAEAAWMLGMLTTITPTLANSVISRMQNDELNRGMDEGRGGFKGGASLGEVEQSQIPHVSALPTPSSMFLLFFILYMYVLPIYTDNSTRPNAEFAAKLYSKPATDAQLNIHVYHTLLLSDPNNLLNFLLSMRSSDVDGLNYHEVKVLGNRFDIYLRGIVNSPNNESAEYRKSLKELSHLYGDFCLKAHTWAMDPIEKLTNKWKILITEVKEGYVARVKETKDPSFKSMQEYIIELVPNAWMKQFQDYKYKIPMNRVFDLGFIKPESVSIVKASKKGKVPKSGGVPKTEGKTKPIRPLQQALENYKGRVPAIFNNSEHSIQQLQDQMYKAGVLFLDTVIDMAVKNVSLKRIHDWLVDDLGVEKEDPNPFTGKNGSSTYFLILSALRKCEILDRLLIEASISQRFSSNVSSINGILIPQISKLNSAQQKEVARGLEKYMMARILGGEIPINPFIIKWHEAPGENVHREGNLLEANSIYTHVILLPNEHRIKVLLKSDYNSLYKGSVELFVYFFKLNEGKRHQHGETKVRFICVPLIIRDKDGDMYLPFLQVKYVGTKDNRQFYIEYITLYRVTSSAENSIVLNASFLQDFTYLGERGLNIVRREYVINSIDKFIDMDVEPEIWLRLGKEVVPTILQENFNTMISDGHLSENYLPPKSFLEKPVLFETGNGSFETGESLDNAAYNALQKLVTESGPQEAAEEEEEEEQLDIDQLMLWVESRSIDHKIDGIPDIFTIYAETKVKFVHNKLNREYARLLLDIQSIKTQKKRKQRIDAFKSSLFTKLDKDGTSDGAISIAEIIKHYDNLKQQSEANQKTYPLATTLSE
jgi:hypothetical protein